MGRLRTRLDRLEAVAQEAQRARLRGMSDEELELLAAGCPRVISEVIADMTEAELDEFLSLPERKVFPYIEKKAGARLVVDKTLDGKLVVGWADDGPTLATDDTGMIQLGWPVYLTDSEGQKKW